MPRKKSTSEGLAAQRSVRLTPQVDQQLSEFCRATRRDLGATIRGMIEIFLQDGIQAASERMNRGIWETSQMSPEEARKLADEMVRNAQAASDAAKQKALREKRRPA